MQTKMSKTICLEWKDINYNVQRKEFSFSTFKSVAHSLDILKDVSGSVKSGNLVAILGSSGAGKTSLLAVISQRLKTGFTGDIHFNGYPINRREMIKISSFVPQFDITIDVLTAREHLNFTCQLRLCKMSKEMRSAKISNILRKLALSHVLDTKICLLSGGERKKLNLVTELLTDPKIIFCDEPTTGLDSFSALSIVKSLRCLTRSDHRTDSGEQQTNVEKAILCTIHQPNSDVFHCFTHVILMKCGRIVFQGTSQEAMDHFSSLGYVCPATYNPAEFYVKIMTENAIGHKDPNQNKMNEPNRNVNGSTIVGKNYNDNVRFQIGWLTQVYILLKMFSTESRRNIKDTIYTNIPRLCLGIIIGLAYANVQVTEHKSIVSIQGFMFNIMADIMFCATFSIMYYYPSKLPIMRREVGEHFYYLSAYYVSNVISYIPKSFCLSFISLSCVYPLIGFSRDFWLFLKIGLTLSLSSIAATAEGMMISCVSGSARIGPEIAPPLHTILLLVAGVYIMVDYYPRLKYISIYYYTMEALSILFWSDINHIDCPPYTDYCAKNGTDVLETYSYGNLHSLWVDYVGLIVLTIFMHIIGFIFVGKLIKKVGYY